MANISDIEALERENKILRNKVEFLTAQLKKQSNSTSFDVSTQNQTQSFESTFPHRIPNEIYNIIFERLDHKTVKICRAVCKHWNDLIMNVLIRNNDDNQFIIKLPSSYERMSFAVKNLSTALNNGTSWFFKSFNMTVEYYSNANFRNLLRNKGRNLRSLTILEENYPNNFKLTPYDIYDIIQCCPNIEELNIRCRIDFQLYLDENVKFKSTKISNMTIYCNDDEHEQGLSEIPNYAASIRFFGYLITASTSLKKLNLQDQKGKWINKMVKQISEFPSITRNLEYFMFNGSMSELNQEGTLKMVAELIDFETLHTLIITDDQNEGLRGQDLLKVLKKVKETLSVLKLQDNFTTNELDAFIPTMNKVKEFRYFGDNLKYLDPEKILYKFPNIVKLVLFGKNSFGTSQKSFPCPNLCLVELWLSEPLENISVLKTWSTNFPNLKKLLVTLQPPAADEDMKCENYITDSIQAIQILKNLNHLYIEFSYKCFGIAWDTKKYNETRILKCLDSLKCLTGVNRLTLGCGNGMTLPWLGNIFLQMDKLRAVTLFGCNMTHADDPEFLQSVWDKNKTINICKTMSYQFFEPDYNGDW